MIFQSTHMLFSSASGQLNYLFATIHNSAWVHEYLYELFILSSLLVVYQKWYCWIIVMSWELKDGVMISVHCQLD